MSYRDEDNTALLTEFCDWFATRKGVGEVNRKPNDIDVAIFLAERKAKGATGVSASA